MGQFSKIDLELFSFEAGVDYLPYYQKLVFEPNSSHTLADLLAFVKGNIDNYGCESIAFRLNGTAIFSNQNITELMATFGSEWCIEPLSTYYAKKDLIINTAHLLKQYEAFFVESSFLSANEREVFEKDYLLLNLISPLRSEYYLGEGFFLYIKWLIERHKDKENELSKWLMEKHSGIVNATNIAQFVYPRAFKLDSEILSLMQTYLAPSAKYSYLATLK